MQCDPDDTDAFTQDALKNANRLLLIVDVVQKKAWCFEDTDDAAKYFSDVPRAEGFKPIPATRATTGFFSNGKLTWVLLRERELPSGSGGHAGLTTQMQVMKRRWGWRWDAEEGRRVHVVTSREYVDPSSFSRKLAWVPQWFADWKRTMAAAREGSRSEPQLPIP
ncbi:unnamed protein product [Amoebophrya sp. A120]|nr:unnamed protein product [Amoebophrya sp. A120]|eukprot:GSA120T00012884001.1